MRERIKGVVRVTYFDFLTEYPQNPKGWNKNLMGHHSNYPTN